MAAISQFLSLDLVSLFTLSLSTTVSDLANRSKAWNSLFRLLNVFILEQKCFLPDPCGNVHRGRLSIPLNTLSIYFIEMLLNAYNC